MWRFCWHDWSPWTTYKFEGISYGGRGYLITGDVTPRRITETRQARRCKKCGKELHRVIAHGSGSTPLTEASA